MEKKKANEKSVESKYDVFKVKNGSEDLEKAKDQFYKAIEEYMKNKDKEDK